MLYMAGGGKLTRVHGPFVEDSEVEKVTKFLSNQSIPDYDDSITEEPENLMGMIFIIFQVIKIIKTNYMMKL